MKLNRYPGSKPFTADYKDLFFGREQDIETLAKYIAVEKITVLYGKSGLGKSSLLNAGVIPELSSASAYKPFAIRFKSYIDGESSNPTDIFIQRLIGTEKPNNFLNKVEEDNISLWQYMKGLLWEIKHPPFPPSIEEIRYQENKERKQYQLPTILLLFDQFEELFTYPEEGINSFIESFAELLNSRMPKSFRRNLRRLLAVEPDSITNEELIFLEEDFSIKVIFSVRSDRLSLLNRLTAHIPDILRNCYELMPLSKEQAKMAITKPAQLNGDFISSKFTYAQDALDKILDYLTQNSTKAVEPFQLQVLCNYVEENIVIKNDDVYVETKDIGNLSDIYQNYYTTQLNAIPDENERYRAEVFIEEQLIREDRRISLDELVCRGYIKLATLQTLVNRRLLRSEPNSTGGYSYELSHDTLLTPILKIKEERVSKERQIEEEKRTQIEAEKERQKTAKEREEREKKFKRQRVLIGVISFACVVSLSLTIWAFSERQKALEQETELEQAFASAKYEKEQAEQQRKKAENALTELKKNEAKRLFNQAKELIFNNNYEGALPYLEDALKLDSLNIDIKKEISTCKKEINLYD